MKNQDLLKNIAWLTLATVLGTGCSRTDLVVRFADTYLMSETDNYLDLTHSQKKELKPGVTEVVQKIREQDFIPYADFLEGIANHLEAKGMQKEVLSTWFTNGEKLYRESLRKFEPLALRLGETATPEQIAHFRGELEKKNEELRKKTATSEKRLEYEKKRALKWADFWIGDLNRAQTEKLEKYLQTSPMPTELQLKNREKMTKDLTEAVGPSRLQWIRDFYQNLEKLRMPEYNAALQTWRESLKDFLVSLWNDLNIEQRKTLLKNLREKAADLRRLSKVS